MSKSKIAIGLAVAALLLMFPAVVMGQQVPPHLSAVSVSVDGAAADDGTEVTAWIDGEQVASATTADGVAVIVIPGDASFTGKTISYKVGELDAPELDNWEQGGHVDSSFSISVSSEAAGATLEISLFEDNHFGQSGFATLTESGGKTRVVMSLNPGAMKTELAHIHTGQCGETLGGVAFGLENFVGGSGESTKVVDATLATLQNGNHAINLHQAGNPGTYTACGNIPKPGEQQDIYGLMTAPSGASEPGTAGEAGAAGSKGDKGDPGPAGESGPQGDKGDPGPAGAAGSAGADGAAGAAGRR